LLRVVQSAQLWAAKKVHSMRLAFALSVCRIANHSCRERGFQFTLNITLTPLHMNLAKTHLKRMWSTDSGRPQSTQFPSEGPPREWIWSFDGRRPRQPCQVKILILRGNLGFQISLVTGSWGPLHKAR
jgi:hypothetical protein